MGETLYRDWPSKHQCHFGSKPQRGILDCIVSHQVTQVLMAAIWCTDQNPHLRPTMKHVVKLLEDTKSKEQPNSNRNSFSSCLSIGLVAADFEIGDALQVTEVVFQASS